MSDSIGPKGQRAIVIDLDHASARLVGERMRQELYRKEVKSGVVLAESVGPDLWAMRFAEMVAALSLGARERVAMSFTHFAERWQGMSDGERNKNALGICQQIALETEVDKVRRRAAATFSAAPSDAGTPTIH